MNQERLIELKNQIADALEEHIRPLFIRQQEYKFTFLARIEDHNEADICVTQENYIEDVKALLDRSKERQELR